MRNNRRGFTKSLILAGMIAGAMCMTGCGAKYKADLADYADIHVDGVDGKGTISCSFWKAYDDLAEEYDDGKHTLGEMLAYQDALQSAVEVSYSQEDGLENGDVVTVTVDIDKSRLKKYKTKLTCDKITYEVSGLKEVPVLTEEDVFEGVQVQFDGIDPDVSASLDVENPRFQGWYDLDKRDGLKIGDKVTVTCTAKRDGGEDYMIPDDVSMEKQFEVPVMKKYVGSVEEIPQEFLDAVNARANELMAALSTQSVGLYEANGEAITGGGFWTLSANDSEAITNVKPVKYVVLNKISDTWGVTNEFEIIYSFSGTWKGVVYDDIHIALWLNDLVIDENGQINPIEALNLKMSNEMYRTYEGYKYSVLTPVTPDYNIVETDWAPSVK